MYIMYVGILHFLLVSFHLAYLLFDCDGDFLSGGRSQLGRE